MHEYFQAEIERIRKQNAPGKTYAGPALPFKHMGHDREAAILGCLMLRPEAWCGC